MQVKRDMFLKRLIACRRNGMVKVITGLRRCGKSYLLGVLDKDYLLADGVGQDHIIEVSRHFYKPVELRSQDEIAADIAALEKANDGLLKEILG